MTPGNQLPRYVQLSLSGAGLLINPQGAAKFIRGGFSTHPVVDLYAPLVYPSTMTKYLLRHDKCHLSDLPVRMLR